MAKKPSNPSLLGESRRSGFWYHKKSEYYDYNLVAVIVLLLAFGLIMLYSASAYIGRTQYGSSFYHFRRQAVFAAIGFVAMLVISAVDYHILRYFAKMFYVLSNVLMLLVVTPLGSSGGGAHRWLQIGPIRFQPSELAKIAVIIYFASLICKLGRNLYTTKNIAMMISLGALPAVIAHQFTQNLSTAIIILGIALGILFVCLPGYKWFLGLAAIGAAGVYAVIQKVLTLTEPSSNYQINRILMWLKPELFDSDATLQSQQALYAIGSSGLFGRGIGNSIQKYGYVPEPQNDFIFSIIVEELGIVGAVVVLAFFGYLLYRILFIALNASDRFGSILTAGVFIHIALQVILNIMVVTGWAPNTGVSLPFISYGGTSLTFTLAEIGLVLGVSRQIHFEDPEQLL